MKIISAYIYGFGKWQDFPITFNQSENQLTIVSGENESGKSTLRQFLLFMLFGLPPKKREFYLPKTGGRMGGRLTIQTLSIEFTIERIHDRNNGIAVCYDLHGNEYDEKWLKDQLQSIDYETYSSIFSFDSNDLSKLHLIDDKELGDVLLGIGMTGTDKLHTIEKSLDKELNHLFKIQGKKPIINNKLDRVIDLNQQLKELQQKEATYGEKKQFVHQLNEDILQLIKGLKEISEEKLHVQRWIQANSIIQEYYQSNLMLNDIPKVEFPENGVERYQSLKDKLLPLKSEWKVLQENIRQQTEDLNTLEKKQLPETSITKLNKQLDDVPAFQQLKNEMAYKKQNLSQLEEQIVSELNQLNIGLEMNQLEPINFPFHIEEEWNLIKEELNQVLSELDRISSDSDSFQRQKELIEKESKVVKEQLIDNRDYEELKARIDEKKRMDQLLILNEKEEENKKNWTEKWKKRQKNSNIWFITGSLTSIILFVLAYLQNNSSFLWIGVLLLSISIIQQLIVRQTIRIWKNYFNNQKNNYYRSTISDEDLVEYERKIDNHQQNVKALEALTNQHNQLAMQQISLDEQKKIIAQKEKALNNRIQEQIQTYPFLLNVEVNYWPKLYHRLQLVLKVYSEWRETKNIVRDLNIKLTNYRNELSLLVTEINPSIKTEDSTNQLGYLRTKVEEQRDIKKQLASQSQWLEELKEKQRDKEQEMLPIQEEIQQLLEQASVTDEEDFLKKANLFKERYELERKIAELYYQLKTFLNSQEINSIVSNRFKDKQSLEHEYAKNVEKQERLEDQLEKKRQQLADLNSVISSMETSEEYSSLKHQYSLELDTLKSTSKRWAVYQVAKEMLTKTKKVYQQNYLPKLLERTSYFFERLTKGNYIKVYPPQNNLPLQVEGRDGLKYTVEELSQGTNDQLYIALRFAISEMRSKDNFFPFFIDDAFVHFDSNRTAEMVSILQEIATKQQILLFTCNDSILKFLDDEVYVQKL